jgi:hypothetical protein
MTARVARHERKLPADRRAATHDALAPAAARASPHPILRVGELQRSIGNQAMGRLLQRKLIINQPGDAYEQEADRVADAVMRAPPAGAPPAMSATVSAPRGLQRACSCGGTCAECRKDEAALQRKEASDIAIVGADTEAPPIVHEVLRSAGEPLDARTRAFMEPHFGRSFADVRIHADARAAESARSVHAHAYTVGRDIVFASGRYVPGTSRGARLLAHELTHVLQQSAVARLRPTASPGSSFEAGGHAGRPAHCPATVHLTSAGSIVQRDKDDLVRYTGGTSGFLIIEKSGKETFRTRALSGHPGTKEYQKGQGPTPTGIYMLHPAKTNPTVTKLQSGTCGANAIGSGFQKITSNDPSPCTSPSHYCTEKCPTAADPTRVCFTPLQCWGEARLKIEGSKDVADPTGKIVHRDGFYIHGGAHATAVTSGCIKVHDSATFTHLTALKGDVPLCVGTACTAPTTTLDVGSSGDKCAVVCAAHNSIWRSVQAVCRLAGEQSAECAKARDQYAESAERIASSTCKCWGEG